MASLTPRFGLRKPAGSDLVNNNADISDNMDKIDAMLPVGMLTAFVGTVAPAGWLLCNGQVVSRTTFAALFAVIGTRYGAGDGTTTFTLPDLRNRVPAGQNLPTDAVSISSLGVHAHGGSVGSSTASVSHDHAGSFATGATDSHNHTWSGTSGGMSSNHSHGDVTNGTGRTDSGNFDHTHGVSGTTSLGGNNHTHGASVVSNSHNHTFNAPITSESVVPVQTVNYIVKT